MKSVAIITEYNPFHHGHLYHAQQSKEASQSDVSIAIMSGQFMMRGMPAMFNKFKRAQMATEGIDLVVEMPLVGSLSSSDIFAKMGVKVADYLQADVLSFGSESGELSQLEHAAHQLIQLEKAPTFQTAIKSGKSYARIAAETLQSDLLSRPNNILAIAYLKQLQLQQSTIQPMTIARTEAQHHDTEIQHASIASGTAIRKGITDGNQAWQMMVPEKNIPLMRTPFNDQQRLFDFIKFTILQQTPETLKNIYTMSEGFENRLYRATLSNTDYTSFMQKLKTKRYTYTHIQRILMNVLLNFQYADVSDEIRAVRVLAMTSQGQRYLKYLKTHFPERRIITNINRETAKLFKNEVKATEIYNVLTGDDMTDFNTPVFMRGR
ncbi:nucleotidyltransferase [Staphylococcus cornubiensis]|uniref:nucleotidyltransferase n=1 Tax=Staphylococcus cornubiensis TaxID=1986155 RepID=UPI000A3CB60C|nr:nucleotidyltransferase [Staphylococcus cornubiensis]